MTGSMTIPVLVGFSGTRHGLTLEQRRTLLAQLHAVHATHLHHGDCKGGDFDAHQVGKDLGLFIVGHPPTSHGLRAYCACDEWRDPRPYLIRNQDIVVESQMLFACPDGNAEKLRSGTWSTVRHSRRLGKPRLIIFPDGTYDDEGTRR